MSSIGPDGIVVMFSYACESDRDEVVQRLTHIGIDHRTFTGYIGQVYYSQILTGFYGENHNENTARAALSRSVKKMESRGLIQRIVPKRNKSNFTIEKSICLTDAGYDLACERDLA